ncbi:hypothetical protein [Niveibacterium umoris]|uniref:Uncharacterized protein n=1 Tax=Niveibacterium umoris TaxID=1193620 RepID=A0A840BIN5_9RHOO|nr:hypothetical protein [Niveibacterium umoris]MBB4013085.1 hypothetical protein [Niveibacterium umoris]
MLRRIAFGYLSLVFLAAAWAFYGEFVQRNSGQEYMFPGMLLAALTYPSAFSIGLLFDFWPEVVSQPFVVLGVLALCGVFQAGLLLAVGKYWRRSSK